LECRLKDFQSARSATAGHFFGRLDAFDPAASGFKPFCKKPVARPDFEDLRAAEVRFDPFAEVFGKGEAVPPVGCRIVTALVEFVE